MWSPVRGRSGIKIALGYVTTSVFISLVGIPYVYFVWNRRASFDQTAAEESPPASSVATGAAAAE